MKKIILLIIAYCVLACQKDDQVAKVYENRQKILRFATIITLLVSIQAVAILFCSEHITVQISDLLHILSNIKTIV